MRIKNKKGAEKMFSNAMIFIAILIISVFVVGLLVKMGYLMTASVSSSKCHNMIIAGNQIKDFAQKHQMHTAIGSWEAVKYFVPVVGMWWAAEDVAKSNVNDGVNKAADTIKNTLLTYGCNEIPYKCEGPANEVANCLYGRAVDTYYTALGGYDWGKVYASKTLYAIKVNITSPGVVYLQGPCQYYIHKDSDFAEEYMCSKGGLEKHRICWNDITDENEKKLCKIEFKDVNLFTMGISMISVCQNATGGPESLECKCFVKPEYGYDSINGLPLGSAIKDRGMDFKSIYGDNFESVFTDITATARYRDKNGRIYAGYSGCGYRFVDENRQPWEAQLKLEDVTIYNKMIHVGKVRYGRATRLYTYVPGWDTKKKDGTIMYHGRDWVAITTHEL